MELTRRSFLKGAGATAGAAAVASLAGCSSDATSKPAAESSDTTNTTAAEGTRWSWDTKPDLPTDDEIVETYDCDICVVGLGAAGPSAMYYAMQKGYNVVALQKLECMHNGGGGCGVFNTKDPEDWGLENGFDFQTIMQGLVDVTCGKTNHKLIRRMVFKSGPAVEWIAANVPGANLEYILIDGDHFGTAWSIDDWESTKTGIGIVGDWMCNWATENGGTILYETPATQLIQDDSGTVTGVIAQNKNGEYIRVNTSEGVILCTGDICDNEEMLERWFPEGIDLAHFNARNGLDGDAVKMGTWVGAAIEPAPANTEIHLDVPGNAEFKAVPWLTVNINGERFMNENQWFEFVTNSILHQPEHSCYQIIDSHLLDHISEYNRAFFPANSMEAVDAMIDNGAGFKADSITDLADQIGLDANKLQKVIDRFNSFVDAGYDEDFFMDPHYLQYAGIKDAPFYAFHYVNGINCVDAGLMVDDQMRVLNEEGEIIPGLWAAGNASGGMFGPDYPARYGGFSVGRAVTGGMVAVQSIMGTVDEDF
ncbi:FAD-binding protein [Adlercreutzia sp. ZJ138]|uniref:FAD-dependent oxidoreductase n=1 Tax=Adlercreutzia sp. ZJ138 TaxID=2709405 RepID=UPI0013EA8E65|nr:FAD-binding protein [Adlercreutzia sp. ZJ138]